MDDNKFWVGRVSIAGGTVVVGAFIIVVEELNRRSVVDAEIVVVGDVSKGTVVGDGVDDVADNVVEVVDVLNTVSVVVVLGTVEVVDGARIKIDVVVVGSGCVVVVLDDVGELVVDVTVVGVCSVVVVVLSHVSSVLLVVVVATGEVLVDRLYTTPAHHLFGSPQHTPVRKR